MPLLLPHILVFSGVDVGVELPGPTDLFRAPVGTLEDRLDVHAVDLLVLDAVGVELGGEIGHGRGPGDGGAHTVLVVLDDEQGRVHTIPAPETGQVGRLVEGTLVYRT